MILVVGDAMLDVYDHHEVIGMEPTAPVPKIAWQRREYSAGGAANVAANVASLGGEVHLVAAWGEDEDGGRLASSIPCPKTRLVGARTVVKRRIVAEGHLVVRIDSAHGRPTTPSVPSELVGAASVVLVADYNHGVVTDALLSDLKGAHARVIVDPKRVTGALAGVYLLKPNLREAAALIGREGLAPGEIAEAACETYSAAALVTAGADGAWLSFRNGALRHFPGHEVNVFDVTGAGDTVIAAVAVALSEGATVPEAVEWAMRAAAVAVQHTRTYAVRREEVEGVCV